MKYTGALKSEPKKSEVDVFRPFPEKYTKIQKNLKESCHHSDHLLDRLVDAADLPSMVKMMHTRNPEAPQEAIALIAPFLSHEVRSSDDEFCIKESSSYNDEEHSSFRTFKFHVHAWKKITRFPSKVKYAPQIWEKSCIKN